MVGKKLLGGKKGANKKGAKKSGSKNPKAKGEEFRDSKLQQTISADLKQQTADGHNPLVVAVSNENQPSALSKPSANPNPSKLLDVGYNGAELTLQLLKQRADACVLRNGWMRGLAGGKNKKKADEFLVGHALSKLAKGKLAEGRGNTMFKPTFQQLEQFDAELKEFVLGRTNFLGINGKAAGAGESAVVVRNGGDGSSTSTSTPHGGNNQINKNSLFGPTSIFSANAGGGSIFDGVSASGLPAGGTSIFGKNSDAAKADNSKSNTDGTVAAATNKKPSRAERLLQRLSSDNKDRLNKNSFNGCRAIRPQKASEIFKQRTELEKKKNAGANTNKNSGNASLRGTGAKLLKKKQKKTAPVRKK
eukprot:g17587.t1